MSASPASSSKDVCFHNNKRIFVMIDIIDPDFISRLDERVISFGLEPRKYHFTLFAIDVNMSHPDTILLEKIMRSFRNVINKLYEKIRPIIINYQTNNMGYQILGEKGHFAKVFSIDIKTKKILSDFRNDVCAKLFGNNTVHVMSGVKILDQDYNIWMKNKIPLFAIKKDHRFEPSDDVKLHVSLFTLRELGIGPFREENISEITHILVNHMLNYKYRRIVGSSLYKLTDPLKTALKVTKTK
jgi:hypothetical protein